MSNKQLIKKTIDANIKNYGKNVYLLGTAIYGPTNQPILIKSLANLYNVYGNEGSLIEAYQSIRKIFNNVNVYCCKISGSHSTLTLNVNVNGDNIHNDAVILKSIYANELYNDISVSLFDTSIVFKLPDILGGTTLEYNYSDYENVQNLIDSINLDTDNNKNCVYASYSVDESTNLIGAFDTVNSDKLYFYGGESGLKDNKNKMYDNLQNALNLLEGEDISVIIPLEMYMDDIDLQSSEYGVSEYGEAYYKNTDDRLTNENNIKSYYDIVLKYCANQLNFGITTFGVLGFNNIHSEIEYLKNIINTNKYNLELENFRGLVSTTYGKLSVNDKIINSSCIYGTLITSTDINTSPINLSISDKLILEDEFDNATLNNLHEIGIISFRNSPYKKTVVATNDVTTANKNSELLYMHNLRQVQFAISCIYDVFQLYVGEDINSLISNDKLQKSLNIALDILIENSVLQNYTILVKKTSEDTITVEIGLKNKYMVEFVTSSAVFESKVTNYERHI